MTERKRKPISPSTHDPVLDAAERLLRIDKAAFSMRDLAAEARVSFATPFNRFGSKAAIMQALSGRLIDRMASQLGTASLPGDAPSRVRATVDIAVAVMLEEPCVNKAIMAAIGAPSKTPGSIATRSSSLWATAVADGKGLAPATRVLAHAVLPDQLAVAFRGVLSFWTAGEIEDERLSIKAHAASATILFGFVDRRGREKLVAMLSQ